MRWRTSIDLTTHGIALPGPTRLRASRAVLLMALGLGLAAVGAWAFLALGAISGAHALSSAGGTVVIDATHLPPLLTTTDDHLGSLKYDISCMGPTAEVAAACDIEGTVFARTGVTGAFHALPLHLAPGPGGGRYVATLPAAIANSLSGFSYYAVIRDRSSGASTTLPAGGASAPQRSLRLSGPISVDLGAHHFDLFSPASARVAVSRWGDGMADVGIEEGPQLTPIGASSFDVDTAGTVTVLDEAHKRLLRFASGSPSTPASTTVNVRGTIADLAVRSNGSAYVLESVADPGEKPVLRSFDPTGRVTGLWHTAEITSSTLRLGPGGPQALEYPASQWMPIAAEGVPDGTATSDATTQLALARSGRAVAGGREIVAQREGNEARVALIGPGNGERSWRIHSVTPLAEIQLAEPLGDRVVVVVRTYTDTEAAFVALVLGDRGIERQPSIDASEWAETAPLSRFRLVGSSLYHLGSTPAGMFVDRFDLEGNR